MPTLVTRNINIKYMNLDPRTKLILLFIVNIIIFTSSSLYIEVFLTTQIALLLSLCGCLKSAVKWTLFYGILVSIQFFILPILPTILAMTFSILAVYARKLLPCLMLGALLLQTTSVRLIMVALGKWHFPKKILIPLAVTIRYFPALKEEYAHIKDAMKLREIKGFVKKIECIYVPILISAVYTAEELSAAAITRGIDNPATKTCVIDIRFHLQDYICFGIAIFFMITALIIR